MSKFKKIKHRSFWTKIIGLICASLLFIACLSETSLENIKNMPKLNLEKNIHIMHKRDFAYHFMSQTAFNSVPTKVPTDIKLLLWDSSYQEVDYNFFIRFNAWFKELLFDNGLLSLGSNGEALDCENYAMLYKSTIGIANLKSGKNKELSVGIAIVRQEHQFAGIPANRGLHALNLIMTNRGWYIFEPQTNQLILLENYPNQEFIQYIIM